MLCVGKGFFFFFSPFFFPLSHNWPLNKIYLQKNVTWGSRNEEKKTQEGVDTCWWCQKPASRVFHWVNYVLLLVLFFLKSKGSK